MHMGGNQYGRKMEDGLPKRTGSRGCACEVGGGCVLGSSDARNVTRPGWWMEALLLFGGQVWGHPGCDAMLLAGGRVVEIGRGEDFVGRGTTQRDVGGGAILPGFIDGHTHLVESGLAEIGWRLDVSGCGREETLARIAAAGRLRSQDEWLFVTGWDESQWSPSVRLRRSELDRVVPGTPAVAVRVDGHLAVANSEALNLARCVVDGAPRLVDVELGEVREAAVSALLSLARPDDATIREALRAAAGLCHRLGITTAHIMTGCVDPHLVLDAAPDVRLRVVAHPAIEQLEDLARDGVRSGQGDAWARWGGVKLFADGSVGARNAAVSLPYTSGGRGVLNHPTAWLSEKIAAAERSGWQTITHAIGDRAIGRVLDAHRRAGTDPGLRHRVEHYEFPTVDQIRDTAKLGLAVCMQPNFVGNWSGRGRLYDVALGAERDAACDPFSAILAAGIPLGFGSDGMPLSPLYGIASAVRAPHEGQRIPLEDAIRGYTEGSAFLSGGEPSQGRLAPGGRADLVVLDGPLDAETLARRSVALTWVGGEIVYNGMEDV
jgi:predicted amidohydrolase YtcJ